MLGNFYCLDNRVFVQLSKITLTGWIIWIIMVQIFEVSDNRGCTVYLDVLFLFLLWLNRLSSSVYSFKLVKLVLSVQHGEGGGGVGA